ncbi:right-handed parallel beta-helix repeat-containing protein [Jeotgalibacillus marinus]|uniref:Right-handed parallel beta-helix repeat-containing protein n=1 Tax=Jeotgalibacillus marinus TaxID=86667 RepID=A0ABV3Q1I9_9BACL
MQKKHFLISIVSIVVFSVLLFITLLIFHQKVLIVGDGFQYSSIQDAVDAAGSGDIILVTSSLSPYEEAVYITDKVGIKIIGIGKPILDGSTLDPGSNGITISNSSKINIQGLIIQQYPEDFFSGGKGILVEDSSSNNIFVKNKLIQNELEGILNFGGNSIFLGNELVQNGIEGIDSHGGNNIFIKNEFVKNGFADGSFTVDAFDVHDDHNILIRNKLIKNADDAIDIDDDFNIIIGNIAIENGESGIIFDDGSKNNIVIRNRWENNVEDGILLDDRTANNILISNKIIGNQRDGIRVGDRTRDNIIKNNIIMENGRGIFIRNDDFTLDQGNKIFKNRIVQNEGDGIFFEGATGNFVKNNKIFENNRGIFLRPQSDLETTFSQRNMITGNKVKKNKDDGINIEESFANTIQKNKIIGNGDNGIFLDINSTNNRVFFNRVFNHIVTDIHDEADNLYNGNSCGTSIGANVDCPN